MKIKNAPQITQIFTEYFLIESVKCLVINQIGMNDVFINPMNSYKIANSK